MTGDESPAPTSGRWPPAATALSVAVLCAFVLLTRRGPLASDQTWSDEAWVLSGAHGQSHEAPATWFHRADFKDASFRDVLRSLAKSDAYPPLVYTVAYFSAKMGDPILAPRWIFVLATAASAASILLAARRLRLHDALLVTMLAFCASGLARTGGDVKWVAVAPALMTLCTLTLLLAVARDERRFWILYGVLAALCLSTHYFMLPALPAHGLYVAFCRRSSLKAWAVTASAAVALCLPWYLWAVPQQFAYVDGFFFGLDRGATLAAPAWRTPLTLQSWLVWLGYNVLTAFGVQPSAFRSAVVLPFALLVLTPIVRSLRRAPDPVRQLALVGALQMALAFLGQTFYALHFGHTAMLTWAYFPTWYPTLLLACGVAGMTGGRTSRLAVMALCAWTIAHALFLPPEEARYRDSVDHRRELAALVERVGTSATAIVHRTDDEARLFNLYYRDSLAQTVCVESCDRGVPEAVDTLLVISPESWRDLRVPGEWTEVDRQQLGRASVVRYRRSR